MNKQYFKYIAILLLFSLFVVLIIFTSQNNSQDGFKVSNSLEVKKETKDKISINEVGNNLFQIEYHLSQDNEASNNKYSETIFAKFENLKSINNSNNEYIFRKSCKDIVKKYIILLDVSGSVVNKIGEEKYVNDLENHLRSVFFKTKLTVGDEIYVGFIGENESQTTNYEFIGPNFIGELKNNTVKHKKTFMISEIEFSDQHVKCLKNNYLSNTISDIIKKIGEDYKTIREKRSQNTYIGDTINMFKSDLKTKKYEKVVYIMFTDGIDNSVDQINDTNFKNCITNNCNYDFIKHTENDEAYVFWSNKNTEENFRKLFYGINLNIN